MIVYRNPKLCHCDTLTAYTWQEELADATMCYLVPAIAQDQLGTMVAMELWPLAYLAWVMQS